MLTSNQMWSSPHSRTTTWGIMDSSTPFFPLSLLSPTPPPSNPSSSHSVLFQPCRSCQGDHCTVAQATGRNIGVPDGDLVVYVSATSSDKCCKYCTWEHNVFMYIPLYQYLHILQAGIIFLTFFTSKHKILHKSICPSQKSSFQPPRLFMVVIVRKRDDLIDPSQPISIYVLYFLLRLLNIIIYK